MPFTPFGRLGSFEAEGPGMRPVSAPSADPISALRVRRDLDGQLVFGEELRGTRSLEQVVVPPQRRRAEGGGERRFDAPHCWSRMALRFGGERGSDVAERRAAILRRLLDQRSVRSLDQLDAPDRELLIREAEERLGGGPESTGVQGCRLVAAVHPWEHLWVLDVPVRSGCEGGAGLREALAVLDEQQFDSAGDVPRFVEGLADAAGRPVVRPRVAHDPYEQRTDVGVAAIPDATWPVDLECADVARPWLPRRFPADSGLCFGVVDEPVDELLDELVGSTVLRSRLVGLSGGDGASRRGGSLARFAARIALAGPREVCSFLEESAALRGELPSSWIGRPVAALAAAVLTVLSETSRASLAVSELEVEAGAPPEAGADEGLASTLLAQLVGEDRQAWSRMSGQAPEAHPPALLERLGEVALATLTDANAIEALADRVGMDPLRATLRLRSLFGRVQAELESGGVDAASRWGAFSSALQRAASDPVLGDLAAALRSSAWAPVVGGPSARG